MNLIVKYPVATIGIAITISSINFPPAFRKSFKQVGHAPPSGSTPDTGLFPIPTYAEANCPYGSGLIQYNKV